MTSEESNLELGRFALAAAAEPKWIQNAAAVLGRRVRYTLSGARRLGLVRELHASFEIPLKTADAIAARALAGHGRPESVVTESTDGSAALQVDVERYLSTFTARLSRALERGWEKQRGRRRMQVRSPVEAAREHGVDIDLLLSSLSLTPAERLRRLDENAAFLAVMRRRAH